VSKRNNLIWRSTFLFLFFCGSRGRRGFSSRMLRLWLQESSVHVRVDWPGELVSHILVRVLIKYSDISRLEHSCWIWRPSYDYVPATHKPGGDYYSWTLWFSLSFLLPFFFLFFLRRVLDVHTGRESIKGSYARVRREREQPGAEMSESVDVPPRSTHKTSQVELRCFFRSALTRTSPSSLELFQTARGVIFQAPSKKKRFSLYRILLTPQLLYGNFYFFIIIIRGWMGSAAAQAKNKKKRGRKKTVSQESFYTAAACCV
jgi:hypothetical protein